MRPSSDNPGAGVRVQELEERLVVS